MSRIIEQILQNKDSRREPEKDLSLASQEFDVWN